MRLQLGEKSLEPSARCGKDEDVFDGMPTPPPAIFSVEKTIVAPKPQVGRAASSKHLAMLSHFQDPFWVDFLGKVGPEMKTRIETNTQSLPEMAKTAVLGMTNEDGSQMWAFRELVQRYNSHPDPTNKPPLHNWTPSGNASPLTATDNIMKTGWNLSSIEMYQEVEVEGIQFRTHRRDMRPGAKSSGSGICVETAEQAGLTRSWGIIQHLFRWRPFEHPLCPTFNFASAVWIDKQRSTINEKKDCTDVVIDLLSHDNIKERVVLLDTLVHANVFFLDSSKTKSTAKSAPSGIYSADLYYDMIAVPRNERPPTDYY
jgi:hypothetical protein